MTVQVCPRCQGFLPGCPVCDAPAQRQAAFMPEIETLPSFQRTLEEGAIEALLVEWLVQGIDVSGWNWPMDFPTAHKLCQYAFVRIGYGDQWKDLHCDEFRADLISNDMPYGVYWYVKIGHDWQKHADSIAEIAAQFPYQLDLVIDIEYTELDPLSSLQWLKNFDGRLRSLTGKIPTVYSSAGFWNAKIARSDYFNNHRKWVANWTSGDTPYLPAGWANWAHWQWSADGNRKGREYGSGGDYDMDLDRYNGSIDQFNQYYGTHIKPIGDVAPPPPPPDVREVMVNTGVLNIRNAPIVTPGTIVGTTTFGKIWVIDGEIKDSLNRTWLKSGPTAHLAGWLCKEI